jgi:eukaryotic-like serine/threonine-protein kinase
LLRIDASSGPVQTLCPAPTGPPIAAWNRDGVIVFRAADGLRRVAASGGECAPLTTVRSDRGESRHTAPTFLPDGRRFLYFRASDRADVRGIYVGSLDLTPDRQVATRLFASEQPVQFVAPDILLFSRDSAILAQRIDLASLMPIGDVTTIASDVPSDPGPSDTPLGMSSTSDVLAYRVRVPLNPQVRWFDVDGRQGDPIGEPAPVASLALSRDGSRVAMQRADVQGNTDVWIHDVARRTTTRVTFGGAQNGPAVWSRDDRVLFFASNRSGRLQIFRRSSDLAGAEEQVLRSTGEDTPLDVSPDGRFLLFSRAAVTSADDLWALPLDTPSAQPIPLLDSRAREIQGRFSPDGRYIVYVSNETGSTEVFVRPFADGKVGAPQLVSEGGGAFPLWPTSSELFYVRPDFTVVRVPVKTTPAFERGAAQPRYRAPLSVVSMTAPLRWDATRDGKRFVMVTANDRGAAAHIAVVVNWQQLLASKNR